MTIAWREVAPLGPTESGDIGGDAQLSNAWGRRWALPQRTDGLFPLLTVSWYVATDPNKPFDANNTWLIKQSEYMVCDNPGDPGGTERWCDYRYEEIRQDATPTENDARRACAEMPDPTSETWDGVEFYDSADRPWNRVEQGA